MKMHIYPSANRFHLTDFMSSKELSAVSTMRPRPPGLLVTYQEIVSDTRPPSSFSLDSYAVLDHVVCRQEHRSLFRSIRSHTSVVLPWHHRRFLLSASIRLPSFHAPHRSPPPPKLDFSLSSSKLTFQSQLLMQSDFPLPPPDASLPFSVYLDGSCPDQHSVSYTNPAGWGVYFANLDLDFFGPFGSLPFFVKGSNNTAELQAPLEAISFILSLPSVRTNIHFDFDSQYVIDTLRQHPCHPLTFSLPQPSCDYFTHLSTLATINIHKLKSHTGIPGNERADLNADNGVTRLTAIGRFSSFPPSSLYPLPFLPIALPNPDTFTEQFVATLASTFNSVFPKIHQQARKPYLSDSTLQFSQQLHTLPESNRRAARLRKKVVPLKIRKMVNCQIA